MRIVSGELAPGATIDLEALEDEFGVSRTVVRETIKVLVAKGLVDARPKAGTFVLGRDRWNLLDADLMAWRIALGLDVRLMRELAEVRAMVEPAAARLAAGRATGPEVDAIAAAFARMEAGAAGPVEHTTDADIEFHSAILRAAGNELLAGFHVLLAPALRLRDILTLAGAEPHGYLAAHRAVLEAIQRGDAVRAEEAVARLLENAAEDTEATLRAAEKATRR
jgi:DNA-binding FadR family transcriptional regulator